MVDPTSYQPVPGSEADTEWSQSGPSRHRPHHSHHASDEEEDTASEDDPVDGLHEPYVDEEQLELESFLPRDGAGEADVDALGKRIPRRKRRSRETRSRAKGRNVAADDPVSLIKAVVPETDDPLATALTVRVVLIGSLLGTLGAAVAQLFFYKNPRSHPISSFWSRFRWDGGSLEYFRIGREHVLIAILSSSAATSAYASDIINIQSLFFNQQMGAIAGLTLLVTTQILGFGFAGLAHNLLVKPVAMIWPGTLVTTSLFHTLHDSKSRDTRPRLRFFMFAFIATVVRSFGPTYCAGLIDTLLFLFKMYQFLPTLIFPTLSSIAILCLVNNRIPAFRILSSGYKGFGFANLSFDWNAVGQTGPLFQPWWAALNFYSGMAGMMYIVMPILYFGVNFWNAQEFPSPLNAALYDRNYTKFDVAAVLTPENTLDLQKWQGKGPILLTPFFAITYGLSFAVLTSMVTHVLVWHWKDIKQALFYPKNDDVHNVLMKAYHPVPNSWYLTILLVSLTAATILVATSPLQLPVWGLFLAIIIAIVFLIPVGLIRAVSDTSIGLNVITEFVAGYLLPGQPIANVTFKCYGYMCLSQALDLVGDLKLGHYLKIPPRHMFLTQLLGTIIGCVVNLAVVNFVLSSDSGYRSYLDGTVVDPTGQWDGRKVHIFYSASIIWGAIGPKEFFGGQYQVLYYAFLVGLICPLVPWFLHKRYGSKNRFGISWDKIAFPIIFHGASAPPQVPTNIITCGFIVAYLSQKWAREKHPEWFKRYNYVLSAALDAGASINALVVFILSVTIFKILAVPHWAGNPLTDSEHCDVGS